MLVLDNHFLVGYLLFHLLLVWHIAKLRIGLHGFTHPKTALKNAEALFDLSNKEKDIILKHMWPITITLPNYIESYVVTFADKFCAIQESFSYYKKTHFNKFSYKYAYLLFNILLFKMFY